MREIREAHNLVFEKLFDARPQFPCWRFLRAVRQAKFWRPCGPCRTRISPGRAGLEVPQAFRNDTFSVGNLEDVASGDKCQFEFNPVARVPSLILYSLSRWMTSSRERVFGKICSTENRNDLG